MNVPQELALIERLLSDFKSATLIFALINGILTVSMLIDLTLGVAKARLAGRKIQSFKARKSAIKMISYYGSMLMCFLSDLIFIVCDVYEMPYLSMIIGFCLTLIEVKSWFEKLSEKEQARIEHSAKIVASALQGLAPKVDLVKVAEGLSDDDDKTKSKKQ